MTKPSSFWMLMMIIIRLNLLLWLFRFVSSSSSSSSLVFLEHFQKKASCPFQEYLNQKKWIFLPTLFFYCHSSNIWIIESNCRISLFNSEDGKKLEILFFLHHHHCLHLVKMGKNSSKQWMNERTLNEVNWNRLTMVNWAYTDGHVRCDMVTYMEKTFYSWMNNFFSLFLFGYYSKQSG